MSSERVFKYFHLKDNSAIYQLLEIKVQYDRRFWKRFEFAVEKYTSVLTIVFAATASRKYGEQALDLDEWGRLTIQFPNKDAYGKEPLTVRDEHLNVLANGKSMKMLLFVEASSL